MEESICGVVIICSACDFIHVWQSGHTYFFTRENCLYFVRNSRHIQSFYDKIVKIIIIKIKCIVSYFFMQLATESEAFILSINTLSDSFF